MRDKKKGRLKHRNLMTCCMRAQWRTIAMCFHKRRYIARWHNFSQWPNI